MSFDQSAISEDGGTATGTNTRNTGTTGALVVDLDGNNLSELELQDTVQANVTADPGIQIIDKGDAG